MSVLLRGVSQTLSFREKRKESFLLCTSVGEGWKLINKKDILTLGSE